MFHFGLPSEKLDFENKVDFIERYEKLLYIGSRTDALPLPIARNALYVEISNINMNTLVNETKRRYSLLEDPQIEHSEFEDHKVSEVFFKWGENPGLTRFGDTTKLTYLQQTIDFELGTNDTF